MNCRQVQVWLLEVKGGTSLPPAVQRHVEFCKPCRKRWKQIERLDADVHQLPLPASDSAVRERFWARFAEREQPSATPDVPRYPRHSRHVLRRAVFLGLAASVLFTLGWLLGRTPALPSPEIVERPPSSPPWAPSPVLALSPVNPAVPQLAAQDVRLAAATTTTEQLTILSEMASDLRNEAFRLARRGDRDDLILVANLHDRVLRQGVVGRMGVLAIEERNARIPALAVQLFRVESAVAVVSSEVLPSAADLLRPLAVSARETSAAMRSGQWTTPQAPPIAAGSSPLLAVLVHTGLRLTEETDPMQRADLAAELAEHLAQATVLFSSADPEQAATLNLTLDALMERGVAGNLDRVEADDPDGVHAEQVERIRDRAANATAILERNFQKAPPAAKAGLQKALDASTGHGHDRAAQGSKGKPGQGPPWKRESSAGEKSGPPGLKGSFRPASKRRTRKTHRIQEAPDSTLRYRRVP